MLLPLLLSAQILAFPKPETTHSVNECHMQNLGLFSTHIKVQENELAEGSQGWIFQYVRGPAPLNPIQTICDEIPGIVAVKLFGNLYDFNREQLMYSKLENGSPFVLKSYGYFSSRLLSHPPRNLVLEFANFGATDVYDLGSFSRKYV